MEDEIYIYKGEEFTRKELEGQYGDRLEEAIDTFGIKKKDLTQSPASLAMQEGFPQAVGTDSEDIDDEEFTRNRAATEVISEIENIYKLGEQYSEFVKKHGVQTEESAKSFPTLQERLFALETVQYGDDKKLYTNSQLRANADKINKLYKTVSDSEEELININQQDKTISFDAERYRNALTRTQAFSNQIKKIEREEQEFIEGLPDFVIDDLVAASTSAGRAVVNLFDFASILYDAENVSDRQIKNQFKTIGAKKGLGLSQEQIDKGIAGSIEDGDISAAFTNLVVDGAAQVPQLGAALAVGLATRNPELGMSVYAGIAGANAGAAKYAELISDPTMSETAKVLSSVAVGVTEAVASRVFTGGTQSLIRRLGAEGVKRNMPKGILSQARAYGLPLTKGIADEALEEGFAQGFESFIVDHVIRGEEFNPYAVADAMIIGATMGGSVTSATLLPSYRGSYKTAKRRAEIGREIKRINNTIKSGNLSDAEQEAANNKIFNLKKEANNLRKEDAILYKDMSREDTEEVIRLNRRISLNRDRAIESRTEEGKNLILGEIKSDLDKKKAIEQKYDSKTEEQVPSTEPGREAAVEAQPDTEASEAAVETGRAVQLDEETQGELDDVMRDADFTVSEQETPTRTSKTEAYADEGVQGGIINLIKTKGGELGREFAGAIERIKSTLGEGYRVVVLDDARYRDVTNTTGRGAYDTKNKVLYLNAQQVRNLDKDNVRAVYHEAIHPILTKRFGEASADFVTFKQDLVNAINRSLSGQDAATLISRLEAFEKQYEKDKTTEQQAEEFMTELGAIMTSEDVELLKKSGLLNRVKELINNLLRKLGVDISLDTENEVVEFMNSLAKGVRGGVAVADIVGYDLGKEAKTLDELIDGEAGVAIGSTERTDFQESRKITIPKTDFTADIPQISLGEALEKYGVTEGDKRKRYAIITSDFTKVGYDSQGERVNGGVGFVSIEENVADGVGFASIEESTAKSLFTRLRNNYGDNKNVAVLIMLQSPSSTIGNHYGAKYMYRALKALKSDIGESAYLDALDKSMTAKLYKDLTDSKITKEQIFELFNQVDVLSQEDFVDNLIRKNKLNTSLNFRRGFGRTVLFPTIVTGKKKKKVERENPVAIELNRLGFNMDGFLDEYGQKEFMIQEMLDTDKSSYMVAGFQVNTRNEKDAESAVEQIQSGGILHGLFDGKVPAVKGTNFYLDGLYEVRKNFGIDFIEWRVDKIGSENRKKVDAYSRRKYKKPFTSLSQEKRDKVKEWGIPKGLFIEVKPEQSTRPSTIAQGIPAVSDRGVEIEPVMEEEAPLSESRRFEVDINPIEYSEPSFEEGAGRVFTVDGGRLEIAKGKESGAFMIMSLNVEEGKRRQGRAEALLSEALEYTEGKLTGMASNDSAVRLNYKLGMRSYYDPNLSLEETMKQRAKNAGGYMLMALPSYIQTVPKKQKTEKKEPAPRFSVGSLKSLIEKTSKTIEFGERMRQQHESGEAPMDEQGLTELNKILLEEKSKLDGYVKELEEHPLVESRRDEDTFLQESRAEDRSGTTQVATTVGSYRKVAEKAKGEDVKSVLDYGAGLGLGSDAMSDVFGFKVNTFEPNAERWKGKNAPDFTNAQDITGSYDRVVSLNVLNVVPKDIRDSIVKDIFSKLNEGGKAYISTRGFKGDINNAKNFRQADEEKAIFVIRKQAGKDIEVFQKGFDGKELANYIKGLLGRDADVEIDNSFGSRGVVVTKISDELKESRNNVENYILNRLGFGDAKYIGSGVEADVYDIKGGRVLRIGDEYQNTLLNKLTDKKIEGLVKVFSTGRVDVPVRFLPKEVRGKRKTPIKTHYQILEKLNTEGVADSIENIQNKLVRFLNKKGKVRIGFSTEIVNLLQLKLTPSLLSEKEIQEFRETLSKNELKDFDRIILIFNNAREKGIDLEDQHAGNYGRDSKGNLVALDLTDYSYLDEKVEEKTILKESRNLAPNGQPSNLNDEQYKIVRTPEFKNWFGDWENDPENASKVVDENGEPLVVYHGTKEAFDKFEPSKISQGVITGQQGIGFYFTQNKKEAESYGSVKEIFLSIKNPFEIKEGGKSVSVEQAENILSKGDYKFFFEENLPFLTRSKGMNLSKKELIKKYAEQLHQEGDKDILKNLKRAYTPESYSKLMNVQSEELGADGAVEEVTARTTVYVTYAPSQSKLADGSNRTFDPEKEGLKESRNFDRKTEKAMEGVFYQPKIDERFNKASKRQMANKKLFDRQGIIRRALQDANDLITQAALSVRNGSSAAAKKMYERFNKNIFLNVAGEKLAGINEIIMLRRIISIYDGFDRGIDTFQQEIKDLEAKKKRTKKETARLKAVKKQLADLEAKKANFKNPRKLNRESALARLDEIKQKLRDETGNDQQFFDMDNRASRFFAAMREILKRKLEEGLITQDEYFRLSKYEYSPRMFVDKVFDLQNGDFAKHEKRFMGYGLSENEFKKLKEGSEEDLFMEGDFLLRMVVAASESRVFANRLFKQLGKKVGSYEWLSDTKKNGFSELTYKEDGESRSIYVRNDIAEEIENADKDVTESLGKVGKYFGTNILRAMATGYNPLFPLSNIPMDFANVVMFTDTYDDKSLVKAMIELSRDFSKNLAGIGTITAAFRGTTKADPEVLKNLEEAFEAGIGMDFLTNQGRVKFKSVDGSKLQRIGQTFGDFMSSFGENSELAMRLSVYNKVKADSLKKRKDGDAQFKDMSDAEIRAYAAFKARATIDFSQGGSLAKSLDKMSPYFNASLQGLRVAGNYIRTNPAKAAKKFGEAGLYAITMSVVMQQLFEMFGWDDDDKEAIPEYHRRNYFIIPTSDTDEDGNKKYIKIRKLPQLAPFLRLFELVGETTYRSLGGESEENNKAFYTKGLVDLENTLKDATVFGDMIITFDEEGKPSLDVGVAQYLPPFMKGYIQYITNYDFFRERNISYEKLYNQASPEFEGKFDDNVEEFYKEFGELTGMSPKRTKNAVEVVTTSPSTNLMVGVGYGIANAIMAGDKSFKDVTRGMEKRAIGTANKKYIPKKPSAELNKLLQEYKDNQFVVRKELTKMVVEDNAPKKDVIQYVNGIEDRKLREYAIKKYKKLQRKNKFDDLVLDKKSVYYNLDDYMSEKPELAAEYLFNEFGSLTNQELREVASYISMIRGTRSFSYPPAFMRKYRELQK